MSAAVVLAHGSPHPEWSRPVEAVADGLRQLRPDATVEIAFLAPSRPDLADVVTKLYGAGHRRIRVLPLLLSSGGKHLREDIPKAIEQLRPRFADLELSLADPALGEAPEVLTALAAAAARLLDAEP